MCKRIRNLLMAAGVTILSALPAMAQDTVMALVLERTDGVTATFVLSDKPVLTIANNELTAKSIKEEITVALQDLANYHFSGVPKGIRDVDADGGFAFKDGMVVFSNLREGECVDIYAIDGRKIASLTASPEGRVEIDLGLYERGILIIRTVNGSYKINNK